MRNVTAGPPAAPAVFPLTSALSLPLNQITITDAELYLNDNIVRLLVANNKAGTVTDVPVYYTNLDALNFFSVDASTLGNVLWLNDNYRNDHTNMALKTPRMLTVPNGMSAYVVTDDMFLWKIPEVLNPTLPPVITSIPGLTTPVEIAADAGTLTLLVGDEVLMNAIDISSVF